MFQLPMDASPNSMEDLDILFNNPNVEPVSSTEEFNSSSQQSGNGVASRYEIDIGDLNMSLFPEQLFGDLLFDASRSSDQFPLFSPATDEITQLLTDPSEVLRSTESDDIGAPIQSATDEQLAMIKTSNTTLPVIRPSKVLTKTSSDPSILLSQSVAVTNPTPNRLQLVYQLEDSYRPRYKSDYFPSKGSVRSPRYVADSVGHHCVTLQMPTEYARDLKNEYVRVALLTTAVDGVGHFYSPYKFQRDNEDAKVADENPIYLPVQDIRAPDLGIMKLHLVLIKSKLDQLNQAQPLKLFSDTVETVQNIIPSAKLTPKELISKYQLEKSHIAFTLCTKSAENTYEIHPETTVISSVISEVQSKPTAGPSTSKTEPPPVNSGKKISCPNCAHCFELTDGEESKTKRKGAPKSSTNSSAAKKKKLP